MTLSKSLLAIKKKHFDLTISFHSNFESVCQLQKQAIEEILPALTLELELQEEGRSRARAFLDDLGTIFRFYRRSRFNSDSALSLLTSTLLWRLRTDLDLLSLTSLHPLYVSPPSPENPPLFWLNSQFKDKFNRPCGLITLRSLERTQERTLDEVKEYIVASMEITRRFLANKFVNFLNKKSDANFDFDIGLQDEDEDEDGNQISKWIENSPPLQMTIAFDLSGSGMANLELELLPFLLDLLKNHFPGMVGAVYILNYGWVHSGMWAVAKRVLPEQALARIFFPNNAELAQHFDPINLPTFLGGETPMTIDSDSADISKKFGRRRRFFNGSISLDSPTLEKKSLSRSPSYENIYDVFYSAAGTPWASRPASPRGSGRSTPRKGHESPSQSNLNNPLQMTPSADRKLRHLQMTRGSGELSLTAETNDRNRQISPSHSPRRSRANSSAGPSSLPHLSSPVQSLSNSTKQVRFSGSNSNDASNLTSSPPPTPGRRIGNVRDFRFHLPESKDDMILDLGIEDSESDAESDQSGKAGEKRVSSVNEGNQQRSNDQQPSFFARLRRASRSSFGAMTGTPSAPSEKLNENGKRETSVEAEERSYSLKLRDQQASQSNNSTSPNQLDPSNSKPQITNENPDLPSPELQVPLMEEEPLAGNQVVSSPTVHFFSQRSKKYNGPGIVSPYNSGNPFWGYPAIVPSSSNRDQSDLLNPNKRMIPGEEGNSNSLGLSIHQTSQSRSNQIQDRNEENFVFSSNQYSSTPRQLHSRRRKRDLIRTLSYLFVLRFLAFHRHLRWKFILIWREIFKTLKSGGVSQNSTSRPIDGFYNNDGVDVNGTDSRWKILEEKHRINRLKSMKNRQDFGMNPHSSFNSNQRKQSQNGLKFRSFWKVWLTLSLICLFLKPKLRKSLNITLISLISGSKDNGKGSKLKGSSFSRLIDGLSGINVNVNASGSGGGRSLTGFRVRERLLGV